MPVQCGDVLAGKYRLDRILGVGGMGVVVAAQHLQLKERVALKFLLPEGSRNPAQVERFLREARAAVKIRNEHVVRILDLGRLENGVPFIVMEYLEGSDLAQRLEAQGPLCLEDAVDYLLQACEALAEAHSVPIIHRDLKPSNLFLSRRSDGTVMLRILDFGISRLLEEEDSPVHARLTASSAMVGSPLYMSPEQIRSAKHVDARSDIWALGVVLYEMLTGRPVFEGVTAAATLAMIAADPTPLLRDLLPEAPAEVEQVILRCLEKNAEARFSDVGQLAQALLPFAPPHARLSVDRIIGTLRCREANYASGLSALSAVSADVATPIVEAGPLLSPVPGTSAGYGSLPGLEAARTETQLADRVGRVGEARPTPIGAFRLSQRDLESQGTQGGEASIDGHAVRADERTSLRPVGAGYQRVRAPVLWGVLILGAGAAWWIHRQGGEHSASQGLPLNMNYGSSAAPPASSARSRGDGGRAESLPQASAGPEEPRSPGVEGANRLNRSVLGAAPEDGVRVPVPSALPPVSAADGASGPSDTLTARGRDKERTSPARRATGLAGSVRNPGNEAVPGATLRPPLPRSSAVPQAEERARRVPGMFDSLD